MAYDNLKLEKGLYTTGKSFTQALEQIDPSENYAGTPLEGLDAVSYTHLCRCRKDRQGNRSAGSRAAGQGHQSPGKAAFRRRHQMCIRDREKVFRAIHDQIELVINLEHTLAMIERLPSHSRKAFNYEAQFAKIGEEIERYQKLKLGLYENFIGGVIDKSEYFEFRSEEHTSELQSQR